MAEIYDDRLLSSRQPKHVASGKFSLYFMLPMLLVLAFLTTVFLKTWQDAQMRTLPTVRVSTPGAPWGIAGQNGQ